MQQQQQEDESLSSAVSFCPSFNCYSTDELVDIAHKVTKEINDENSKEDEIDEFEFVSVGGADVDSTRLFFNGEIRQVFPVFNRALLLNEEGTRGIGDEERHVSALKKLFIDDDDDDEEGRQSSSSSDEDEPERQPNAIFCIWSPKRNPIESSPSPSPSPSQSPSRCKKSNSTGSSASSPSPSKKWFKFRDLLKRSNSDGKDSFVFLNKPKSKNNNVVYSKEKSVKSGKAVSPHEAFYVKNRAIKEGDKKKSYLPYKQDLLGFFS